MIPDLPQAVDPTELIVPPGLQLRGYDTALAGSPHLWDDYEIGEKIDHVDGMTIEESEHMMATRLYQNTARVHFNQHAEKEGRFGRRIVYGGHIISLARFSPLTVWPMPSGSQPSTAAATRPRPLPAIRSMPGRKCWTRCLCRGTAIWERQAAHGGHQDRVCADFPYRNADGQYDPAVVLDLDYEVLMPTGR